MVYILKKSYCIIPRGIMANRKRLGVIAGITLGIITIIAIFGLRSPYWQPINRFLSQSQLATVVEQNTTLLRNDLPKVLGHHVKVNKGDLILVNYNDPRLCGTQGCLYSVYLRESDRLRRVLNVLLHSKKEDILNVLTPTAGKHNEFPCLETIQPIDDKQSKYFKYCYNSGEYQLHEQYQIGQTVAQ
jgi:hypothetical protein